MNKKRRLQMLIDLCEKYDKEFNRHLDLWEEERELRKKKMKLLLDQAENKANIHALLNQIEKVSQKI